MANQQHPIDQLFRDKLSGHKVKPSGKAWQKLETQLQGKGKKRGFPFLSIAASLLVLAVVGYVVWVNMPAQEKLNTPIAEIEDTENNQKADNGPVDSVLDSAYQEQDREASQNSEKQTEPANSSPGAVQKKSTPAPKVTSPVKTKIGEQPRERLAVREEEKPVESLPEMDLEPLDTLVHTVELPPMDEWVAAHVEEEAEEVAYRVKIVSNGIREKPQKEPLTKEVGQTINKLGELLGKMDQGYADLQDAKNNLFSALITKADNPE